MALSAVDEAPRPPSGDGFADAVTFAFGDREEGLYGLARAGFGDGGASGLAVLFDGREPLIARAEHDPDAPRDWEAIDAGGVRTRIHEPLRAWSVQFDAGDGRGFELTFEARSTAAELARDAPAAKAGGMEGYDHLCAVSGVVRLPGGERNISCLGQRSRLWGAPRWDKVRLARTLSAWLGDDLGIALTSVRPAKAKNHDDEAISAFVFEGGTPVAVDEPRLSTTTDADGRQRHAGLELWMGDEDGWARRAAGEVLCGTTLDLGRLRLDCSFFAWRMEGRKGVGRYDVLRRVA